MLLTVNPHSSFNLIVFSDSTKSMNQFDSRWPPFQKKQHLSSGLDESYCALWSDWRPVNTTETSGWHYHSWLKNKRKRAAQKEWAHGLFSPEDERTPFSGCPSEVKESVTTAVPILFKFNTGSRDENRPGDFWPSRLWQWSITAALQLI